MTQSLTNEPHFGRGVKYYAERSGTPLSTFGSASELETVFSAISPTPECEAILARIYPTEKARDALVVWAIICGTYRANDERAEAIRRRAQMRCAVSDEASDRFIFEPSPC